MLFLVFMLLISAGYCGEPYMVRDIATGPVPSDISKRSQPRQLVEVSGLIYFTATEDSTGRQLWRTDGTSSGTIMVKCSRPYTDNSFEMRSCNGIGIFSAEDAALGTELWRTDGSPEGTAPILDIWPGPKDGVYCMGVSSGRFVYFYGRDPEYGLRLWRTDGTAPGTFPLTQFDTQQSSPYLFQMADLNGEAFFLIRAADLSLELWKSDGTPGGTRMVSRLEENFFDSDALSPRQPQIFRAGDKLFISSATEFREEYENNEWWVSDGTSSGTAKAPYFPPRSDSFTFLGNALYFRVRDLVLGSDMWVTDGTTVGTHMANIPAISRGSTGALSLLNGKLYFLARGADNINRLYVSDGTLADTSPVSQVPSNLERVYNNSTFFYMSTSSGELWRCDAAEGGLLKLADVRVGDLSFQGTVLVTSRGELFFSGKVQNEQNDDELWKSDGTPTGTGIVKDINRNTVSSMPKLFLGTINHLFFYSLLLPDPKSVRKTLWSSDGTFNGTFPITDVYRSSKGTVDTKDSFMDRDDHALLALTNTSSGLELWRTDGTQAGTHIVRDINPGPQDSKPHSFVTYKNKVYFSAYDQEHQSELWVSDGTASGTLLVKDILEGTSSTGSDPVDLTVFKNQLYFLAKMPDGSRALWQSDGTSEGTRIVMGTEFRTLRNVEEKGLLLHAIKEGRYAAYWSDGTAAGTYDLQLPLSPSIMAGTITVGNGPLLFYDVKKEDSTELWCKDIETSSSTMLNTFEVMGWNFTMPGINMEDTISMNGVVYFAAFDRHNGMELWQTDGTTEGTHILMDLNPGFLGSYPYGFKVIDEKFYFRATDELHGYELWQSDGTQAGTRMIADIAPGRLGSSAYGSSYANLVKAANRIFFTANDGSGRGMELWAFDFSNAASAPWKMYP